MSTENYLSPHLRRDVLGEHLDNLVVPLPMFVLFNVPLFQSSLPNNSYLQLYSCCYVCLMPFQCIVCTCAQSTRKTLCSHLFPTAVPPVSYYPAKSDLEDIIRC